MTQLERQVRSTQKRLWVNRGMQAFCTCLTIAAGILGSVILVQRLFDLTVPLLWTGVGLGVCAGLSAILWTMAKRENARTAAVALDRAAGLRERLSSAHYCSSDDDPFSQAVVTDAERVSGSLSARQHIRLVVPRSLGFSTMALVFAALMLLVPTGLLTTTEASEDLQREVRVQAARVTVKKQMDQVKKLLATNPALEDLKDKLEGLDAKAGGKLQRAADIRHEALKHIDKLADAVKQKRKNAKYGKINETRKILRRLRTPQSPDAQTQKLTKALARGDFKTAKEEVEALRDQLATLKSDKDKELAKQLGKQLADLAKQLEKLSKNDKLAEKLAKLGLTPEQIKRALENMKKGDLEQLKKDLQKKGMSQKQAEKLAKQMQQKQQAGSAMNKMAQGLKKASSGGAGQSAGSAPGMSMAAEQLSELEMLEQEMMQLDSAMADLQGSKNNLGKSCSRCGGRGCSTCQGSGKKGSGMGKLGKGRGGLAPEQQTTIGFKTKRGKVHTGQGAIIGQFLFNGEQVKGNVKTSFSEVVVAAERDASDRINRNRIPRQYHKAVKEYFSNFQQSVKEGRTEESKSGDGGTKSAATSDRP